MSFKNKILKLLEKNKNKKRILFIDGENNKSLESALILKKENNIIPTLLLKEHNKKIEKLVDCIVISDWKNSKNKLLDLYKKNRTGKKDENDGEKYIFLPSYFAMLLIELEEVDGAIGGLMHPTSEILRPAFKLIKPANNIKTISSVMIMEKMEELYLFADISVNIDPSLSQLVDIATNALNFAHEINIEEKIAFLSFSTLGSAIHPKSTLMKNATYFFNKTKGLKYNAIGEIQFDAAFSLDIRKLKYKKDYFKDRASIFIFPSLDAANIGYKIAQRMGGYSAIGPIITGLNKPVNDLSRGATIKDICLTALITALQVK